MKDTIRCVTCGQYVSEKEGSYTKIDGKWSFECNRCTEKYDDRKNEEEVRE